ncbi:hypothetical protein FBZ33_2020 [Micromonospora sp. A202]|nr:hypothetical protein FBZ33_2020 [Micromonospora sp. A202]
MAAPARHRSARLGRAPDSEAGHGRRHGQVAQVDRPAHHHGPARENPVRRPARRSPVRRRRAVACHRVGGRRRGPDHPDADVAARLHPEALRHEPGPPNGRRRGGRHPVPHPQRAGPDRAEWNGRHPEPVRRGRHRARVAQRHKGRRHGRSPGPVDPGHPRRADVADRPDPERASRPGQHQQPHDHAALWDPEQALRRPGPGRDGRRSPADRGSPVLRWNPTRRGVRHDDRWVPPSPGRSAARRAGGQRSAPRPDRVRRADRPSGRRCHRRWRAVRDAGPRPAGAHLGG